jgi:hypothetical protein
LDPSEVAMTAKVVPAAEWKETASATALETSAKLSTPRTFPNEDRIVSSGSSATAKGETAALPKHPLPLGSSPPAQSNGLTVAKREGYVTDGVVLMDSMIKPASHSMPATGQKPPTVLKTGPYVASGVILFSDSTNEKVLQTNPALAALQTRLQERIAAVCGKSNKDIEVTAVTETDVAVRLKANSTLEGEELSNRIFQLPELGPCQVSLDVLVMK